MIPILLMFTLSAQAAAADSHHRAEIEKYRAEREAELKADDGWPTVAGLFWLKPGRNVAGSDRTSDLVLPGKAPARLGVFELTRGRVVFSADPSAELTSGGKRITRARLADGEQNALAAGDLRFFVIRRGDRVGIRMRDLRSPMRQAFKGLEYYPVRRSIA